MTSDLTLVLSGAALAVSLSTFVVSRRRDKRDLLLRMHDHLTTADQQRGRRLIYEMSASGARVEDLADEHYELINTALAALNTLGIYYERRYVPRPALMELWAETILRLLDPAKPFLAHRDALRGGSTWPQLQELADKARKYVKKQGKDPAVIEASARPFRAVTSSEAPGAAVAEPGASD